MDMMSDICNPENYMIYEFPPPEMNDFWIQVVFFIENNLYNLNPPFLNLNAFWPTCSVNLTSTSEHHAGVEVWPLNWRLGRERWMIKRRERRRFIII